MNKDEVDFCERDKRDYGESPFFLLGMSVATVASWTIAAPIALASRLLTLPQHLNSNKTVDGSPKLSFPPIGPTLVEVKPLADREFDLVMYGATGFTGGLACEYLAKKYGNNVKWAIAGRRLDALEQIKQRCLKINPEATNIALIQVDSADDKKLQEMCARTRVVISTVGPYVKYGTPLVRACIATKSNVCDITGEVEWVSGVIDNYDVEAREAGSKVMSFCGHDSIPWDLSTFMLAKKLKQEKGEDLAEIEFVDAAVSKPSGGTLQSIIEHPASGYKAKNSTFSPLYRSDDGSKSPYHLKNRSRFLPHQSVTKQWVGPFVMTMVNAQVVKRSNALNGYGINVVYKEHRVADSLGSVLGRYLQLAAAGPLIMLPDTLRGIFLPLPGSGASKEEMERGFLQVTAVATGTNGSKVGSRLYYPVDAGYSDTARMLVEAGLTLALTPEKCARQAGVLTPGSCCAEALFERLLSTGCEYCYLNM